MSRDYELGIIVNPDVGDEQARAVVERVTQLVTAQGGQVVRVNAWGRRRLAYPIDHHRDGLYFFFDLSMEAQVSNQIVQALRVNEDILRFLVKVRDPRVVAEQRRREAEAEAEAAYRAEQAAREAAAAAAAEAAAETAPAETPAEIPAEAAPAEARQEAAPTEEPAEAAAENEETPATATPEA
jgi:small subunit ribosomal protein S6